MKVGIVSNLLEIPGFENLDKHSSIDYIVSLPSHPHPKSKEMLGFLYDPNAESQDYPRLIDIDFSSRVIEIIKKYPEIDTFHFGAPDSRYPYVSDLTVTRKLLEITESTGKRILIENLSNLSNAALSSYLSVSRVIDKADSDLVDGVIDLRDTVLKVTEKSYAHRSLSGLAADTLIKLVAYKNFHVPLEIVKFADSHDESLYLDTSKLQGLYQLANAIHDITEIDVEDHRFCFELFVSKEQNNTEGHESHLISTQDFNVEELFEAVRSFE